MAPAFYVTAESFLKRCGSFCAACSGMESRVHAGAAAGRNLKTMRSVVGCEEQRGAECRRAVWNVRRLKSRAQPFVALCAVDWSLALYAVDWSLRALTSGNGRRLAAEASARWCTAAPGHTGGRRPCFIARARWQAPTSKLPHHSQPKALAVLDSIESCARCACSSSTLVGSRRRRRERPKGQLQGQGRG